MTVINIDLSMLSGIDPETVNLTKASIDFSPFIAYEYEDGEWLTRSIRKVKCTNGIGTVVLPPTPTGKGYEVQERGWRGVRHGYVVVPDQEEINYSDLQWVTKASLDPVTPPDPAWLLAWQGTQDQLDELSETVSELELGAASDSAVATQVEDGALTGAAVDARIAGGITGKADQADLDTEALTRSDADTALGDAITAEATTRGNTDVALSAAITAEVTARRAIRPTFGDLFKPRLPSRAPSSKVSLRCRAYVTAIDGGGVTHTGAAMIPYVKFSGNPITNAYGVSVDESGQGSAKMQDLETIFTGKDATFKQYHFGSAVPEALRVWVDDEEVDMNPFAFTSAAQWYLDFNFAVYGTYKIRIAGGYFMELISCNVGGSFKKPEPRKRLGFVADSYGESVFGGVLADSPPAWLSTLTGWDVWNGSQGGTGFVATGGGGLYSPFGSAARLAAIDAMEIDALLVNGSLNDWQQSVPTVKAAMLQFYEDVADLKPGMPIVQVGIEPVTYPGITAPPGLAALVAAQAEACDEADNVVGYIDPYTVPWLTGTGDEGVMDNNGNQDYLICTDGIHPSARGSKHYMSLIVDQMKPMRASL